MSKNKNRGKVQGTTSAQATQVATTETVENVVTTPVNPEATAAVEVVEATASTDSVNTPAVQATATETPVETTQEGNGPAADAQASAPANKIPVWPKKDLLGKPQMMDEKKAMEKIVNKGEVVVDPITGENIHLLRVFRGRRVFYSKGRIQTPEVQPEENTEAVATN
jgi:hypothetical protein